MSLTFGAMDVAASIANFLRTSRPEGEHESSPGQSVAAAWGDIEKDVKPRRGVRFPVFVYTN
jgi:hypothetical protein